jgi:hypothetical protein
MTDTPVNPRDVPPVPKSEMIKAFIGDLARPFAIISTSFAASWATIAISYKVENGNDGAIFAGAYFLGVGTLFLGKAVEAINAGRHKRDVDVAQVNATGAPTPADAASQP